MKKIVFFVFLMVFSLSVSTVFAADAKSESELNSDNPAAIENRGDQLSEEEISQIEMRIEEIRDMDKSELTEEERLELRKELKDIKDVVTSPRGIYISVGGLILILILILLLT
ncbi:MAG: hypothetical protein R6U58_15260 [Bacteroidales bacterium]